MLSTFFKMMRSIPLRSPTIIYCIGAMGSGKTTLSLLGYIGLRYYKKHEVDLHYYNGGECGWECIDHAVEDMKSDRSDSISYVILDDYSFVLKPRTEDYYQFLNKLFRIRHLVGKNKIVIWFNGHYSRSLSPFVRSTNYRILTSISPAEIRQYASEYIFRVEDLWEYYNHYISKPRSHIVLIDFRGISKIVDVTVRNRYIKNQLREIYTSIFRSNAGFDGEAGEKQDSYQCCRENS